MIIVILMIIIAIINIQQQSQFVINYTKLHNIINTQLIHDKYLIAFQLYNNSQLYGYILILSYTIIINCILVI